LKDKDREIYNIEFKNSYEINDLKREIKELK
jgi:hypothetical protein